MLVAEVAILLLCTEEEGSWLALEAEAKPDEVVIGEEGLVSERCQGHLKTTLSAAAVVLLLLTLICLLCKATGVASVSGLIHLVYCLQSFRLGFLLLSEAQPVRSVWGS